MRFALLALVGVALAVHQTVDLLPLKPRKEYVFRFEGDVHSGIPLPSDTTVSRIHAMVHVQIPDDRNAIMKLKDVRFATGEDDRKELYKRFEDLKERTISKEHIELLEMPVRFAYKNGMVSDLNFADKEETWSANMKRSVVNMLQLNMKKMGLVDESKLDRYEVDRDNEYFTVTERTIEGDCEVAYTVLKKRDFVTEVTKSVNFDKCTHRPEAKYNFRYLSECPECKEKDILEPTTVYTYLIEKDGLKYVEVRSVYTITVANQPVTKTEIRTRLTLEDVKEIRHEFEWISGINGKKETLIYDNEVEKQIERFFMYGDDIEVLPYEPVKDKIETIRTIMDEMKELKENKHETTHLLSRLVSVLRMLTMEELSTVHSEIYMNVDERLKSMLEHSLAVAGTKNTITHLVRHMEMAHFKTHRIVHLLKIIQETPYPSPQIVDELLHFAKTEKVEGSPVIRQTIWLTLGSVMRGVVGRTMDKTLLREDFRELKRRYVEIIMKEYEKVDTIYEKVLLLKSLANAGIDLSVYELEKIILNKSEELPVRMEAIDALRVLRDTMPRKIQSVLMPVYKSRAQEPELRMAALVRIMHTLPRQPVIAQIISTMEREPNQQVAAFTYDLLNSFAKSTHICYKKLASEILPLLTMTRYERGERIFTSTYKHLPMFKEEIMTGANMDFATIFGKNTVWPKELMVKLDTVFSGMWNKYLFQFGITQQNIEKILNMLSDKLMRMEKTTNTVVRGRRIRESLNLLKDIAKKLGIRPRVVDDRTPYAMIYIRHKDMDYAVLPIDEKIIDELLEKFIRDGRLEKREIERLFSREREFQLHGFTFLHEIIRKLPTTLGLPLILKCKLPTAVSAEGEYTMEMVPNGIRFHLNTVPTVATTNVMEMRLWNPLFEQGVELMRSLETLLPIDVDMEFTYRNGFEIRKTINIPTEEKTLVRFTSRPMTFFRILSGKKSFGETELRTIVHPRWRQLNTDKEKMFNIWGLKTVVRGNWPRSWNMRDILLGEYDWEFVVIPTREAPKKIRVIMNSEKIKEVRLDKIDFSNLFVKELEIEDKEFENFEERERHDRFHRNVRDIEKRDGYRHRMLVKIEAVDSMVEHYGTVEITTVCDEELRYCRNTVEGKRSPIADERRDWKFMMNMQFVLPKMPKTLMELKEQIHREIQGLVEMKWGAEEMNELKMKIQLEQGKEQKKWLKLVDKKREGLTEYDLLLKAARLNQLKVVVDYELTPRMRTLFELIYNYMKGYTFWNHKVTRLNGEHNRFFLKLRVDPVTRSLINVMLETPYERMEVVDMNVPQLYLPTIAKRTLRDLRYEVNKPVCEVKSTKVRTFDDVVFRAPLTNCYSVIAKDCSEEPRFVVMVKKLEKDSDMKKLKIINEREQVITVEMVDGRLKVKIDKELIDREELEKYNIELIEDNMVRVKLNDVMVHFDGYTVKVYMGKHMIERQCGLCGHFDEEKDNEFYTPKNEYTDDIMEFHKSYILKDECDVEKDFLHEKHYRMERREESEEDEEDWLDFYEDLSVRKGKKHAYKYWSEENKEDRDEEMLEKTHVMEFSHRLCFSLEPVRVCRKNEKMDEVMDKKVRFTCLPRASNEARQLLRKVRNEILDLKHYPISFVETVQVPRTCTVY
ncbi:Lipoprotein amino terminal region [Trichostrongylus colubriformis]|uniref:Lipoprotein amino terminal region n=1 Tax=Trichostrongylus colubriformis TaxID=6319 RepID=A0AAN8FMD4_TRICO